ncbi:MULTISPECIES: hypothetical protein [unclassified Pseudomonas]|nr:hypothetical protein [Pseudomonas sp. M47T1]
MIRLIASLLCQALIGLAFGLIIANLAHAGTSPPATRAKLARAL